MQDASYFRSQAELRLQIAQALSGHKAAEISALLKLSFQACLGKCFGDGPSGRLGFHRLRKPVRQCLAVWKSNAAARRQSGRLVRRNWPPQRIAAQARACSLEAPCTQKHTNRFRFAQSRALNL